MKTFSEREQELNHHLEGLSDRFQDREAFLNGLQEISDHDLEIRLRTIEQVAYNNEGVLCFVEPLESPRNDSCIWDCKTLGTTKGLEVLTHIPTVHSYAAPIYFKPSTSECLAQIPDDLLDQVVAFEIVSRGFTPHGSDAHTGIMTLYTVT